MTGVHHRTGAALRVTENNTGAYSVTLLPEREELPKTHGHLGKDRYPFHGRSGPISVVGYYDHLRLEIGTRLTIFGIDLGTFYGSMDEGLSVDIDLGFVKGVARLIVKGGSELWFEPELTLTEPDGPLKGCLPAGTGPVKLTQYPRMK